MRGTLMKMKALAEGNVTLDSATGPGTWKTSPIPAVRFFPASGPLRGPAALSGPERRRNDGDPDRLEVRRPRKGPEGPGPAHRPEQAAPGRGGRRGRRELARGREEAD